MCSWAISVKKVMRSWMICRRSASGSLLQMDGVLTTWLLALLYERQELFDSFGIELCTSRGLTKRN